MKCKNCNSTGCDVHSCHNYIGSYVCNVCGVRAVDSNFRIMESMKYSKRESANSNRDFEKRLKDIERISGSRDQITYSNGSNGGFMKLIKFVIFCAVCWVISLGMNHENFTGILKLIVLFVNLFGAIFDFFIAVVKTYIL